MTWWRAARFGRRFGILAAVLLLGVLVGVLWWRSDSPADVASGRIRKTGAGDAGGTPRPGAAAPRGVAARSAAAQWNQLFRHGTPPPLADEASFVAYCVERIAREELLAPKSKILVIAMGDGRHAVRFARRGHDVTGLDISSVAIAKAERAAADSNVEITTVEADLFEYDLGREKWDMITNVYFNPAIRIFSRIKEAVRPGGLLLVEGYGADYQGPGAPVWSRYRENRLLQELSGWRILEYEDGLFPSEWADGKSVPVMRVLARKPDQRGFE